MKRLYQAEEHKRKVVGEQLSNLLKELYLGHVHKAYYQKTHNGEVVTIIFCNSGFLDINVAGQDLDEITITVVMKLQEYFERF